MAMCHGNVVSRKARSRDLSLVSTLGLAPWPHKAAALVVGSRIANDLPEIKHSRRPHLTPGGIAHVLSEDLRGVALVPLAAVVVRLPRCSDGLPGRELLAKRNALL